MGSISPKDSLRTEFGCPLPPNATTPAIFKVHNAHGHDSVCGGNCLGHRPKSGKTGNCRARGCPLPVSHHQNRPKHFRQRIYMYNMGLRGRWAWVWAVKWLAGCGVGVESREAGPGVLSCTANPVSHMCRHARTDLNTSACTSVCIIWDCTVAGVGHGWCPGWQALECGLSARGGGRGCRAWQHPYPCFHMCRPV